MEYKVNARSPHYGKIFAYDEIGREMKELDVLELKVCHEGKTYLIKELLAQVVANNQQLNEDKAFIQKAGPELEEMAAQINTLSQLVVLLNAKIQKLEVK